MYVRFGLFLISKTGSRIFTGCQLLTTRRVHSVASMEQLRHGVGSRSAHRKRGVHAGDGALIALEKGTLVVCAEMWRPGGKKRLVAAVCLRVHSCEPWGVFSGFAFGREGQSVK